MVPVIVGIDREQFGESVIPLGCEHERLDPTARPFRPQNTSTCGAAPEGGDERGRVGCKCELGGG